LNHVLDLNTYNGTITIIFVRQHDNTIIIHVVNLQSIRSSIDTF